MIENTKPEQSALKLGQLILQLLVDDTEQFWLPNSKVNQKSAESSLPSSGLI